MGEGNKQMPMHVIVFAGKSLNFEDARGRRGFKFQWLDSLYFRSTCTNDSHRNFGEHSFVPYGIDCQILLTLTTLAIIALFMLLLLEFR